jgi:hypothetical protein
MTYGPVIRFPMIRRQMLAENLCGKGFFFGKYSNIYPKHVGVIFNFLSVKLLYNVDFNLSSFV